MRAMETVVVRRPKFDLTFITEESEIHIVHNVGVSKENKFMTESVVSMTSKNALEDDSAAFSFTLAGDMEWDKVLNSNDMVVLKIDPNEAIPGKPEERDEVKNNVVMVGLISEVRLEGTYKDNTKLYRITGQSFAKVFMQFDLAAIRQVTLALTTGWLNTEQDDGNPFMSQITGKTVAQTVRTMLERFMEYMRYNFSDEDTKNHVLSRRLKSKILSWSEDERLTDPTPFLNFEGSFNQLLNEIVQRPFCEKFFEFEPTYDGEDSTKFIVRRTPFDKKDWNNLTRHNLHSRDVISESIAHSDLDAYAIFNVIPNNGGLVSTGSFIRPKFHPALVGKYGYRTLEVGHNYLNTFSGSENSETGTGTEIVNRYSERLYNWYVNNPNFYSGNITVLGHPDYRLGNRLLYRDIYNNYLYEFYIESVEHNFTYSSGYTTTLGVTRGLLLTNEDDDGDRFDPPIGEPQDFKGGYLGELPLDELERQNNQVTEGTNSQNGNLTGENSSTVVKPAEGSITSPFGMRTHPISGKRKLHKGIDIAGGGTQVKAMSSGTVTISKFLGGYGNYIVIDHGNLNEKGQVFTLYAHLRTAMVSVGQKVSAGQQIGVMGNTGNSTGVHLHFEVHVGGRGTEFLVNPTGWVKY